MECIIPKRNFWDDKRLKTLMNFHACCKNGRLKARYCGALAPSTSVDETPVQSTFFQRRRQP
jgi:hypothetical protein